MASASSQPDTKAWQVGKSLSECFLYLFEKQLSCDVDFRILSRDGSTYVTSAHQAILLARSPVFEEMFSAGRSKEQENGRTINVYDIEMEPFKEMLRYLYSEEVTLTGDNVMHVLYAAKTYNIQGLLQKCQDYVQNGLSVENVSGILTASVLYEDADLVQRCILYIAKYPKEVLKTECFLSMSHDALYKLLSSDYLPDGVEEEIFEGCVSWAEHQLKHDCTDKQIRETLGKCIFQIRFHQMKYDRFAEVPGSRDILDAEEKSALLCFIVTKKEVHKNIIVKKGFNLESRLLHVKRYSNPSAGNFGLRMNRTITESFDFTANHPVSIIGLSVHGSYRGEKHEVVLSIEDKSQSIEICNASHDMISEGPYVSNIVCVKKTKLSANEKYKMSVSVTGQKPLSFSTGLQSRVVMNDVTVNMQSQVWPMPGNSKGLILEILLVKHI